MISNDLRKAFDRIDDFLAVHATSEDGITLEAVECLQEAVGIEHAERVLIRERLETINDFGHPGHVVLGMIVGLFVADRERG